MKKFCFLWALLFCFMGCASKSDKALNNYPYSIKSFAEMNEQSKKMHEADPLSNEEQLQEIFSLLKKDPSKDAGYRIENSADAFRILEYLESATPDQFVQELEVFGRMWLELVAKKNEAPNLKTIQEKMILMGALISRLPSSFESYALQRTLIDWGKEQNSSTKTRIHQAILRRYRPQSPYPLDGIDFLLSLALVKNLHLSDYADFGEKQLNDLEKKSRSYQKKIQRYESSLSELKKKYAFTDKQIENGDVDPERAEKFIEEMAKIPDIIYFEEYLGWTALKKDLNAIVLQGMRTI